MGFTPKLSESDKSVLKNIQDPQVRAQVERDLLAGKQVSYDRAVQTRTVFTMKPGTKPDMTSIGGLGYRFPATLPDASWLLILDNAEAIRAFIAAKKAPVKA